VVGAISFCSAAFKLGLRDRFIGWDEPARLSQLPHLVCNNRFLLFPWVKVRNLASHVLSLSLKTLKLDWKAKYDVEPYMAETFVDSDRYRGTCYIADNWIRLGETKGFGRQGKGFVFHGNVKDLYVKVLNRRFASAFHPDIERLRSDRKELLSMITGTPVYFPKILDVLGVTQIDQESMNLSIADHLEPYIPYLSRTELLQHFVAMFKGLLSDLPRKSIEPICLAFAKPHQHRNMTNFMTRSTWDDQGMLEEYQRGLAELISDSDGMLTGDGCDFPKKGKMSVGVARQHCGPLGKVDNCQASVMVGFAGPKGFGLVDYELYMPEKWFDEDFAGKREKCCVPPGLEFRTKNRILSEMINRVYNSGRFKGKYVGVDAAFGRDGVFLDSLPKGLVYFADIPHNQQVFTSRPEMAVAAYSGRGRPPKGLVPSFPALSVSKIIADESVPWNMATLDIGAKGPITIWDKHLRVVEIRDGKPGKDVWLYARRLEDGKIKYSLCNESADATPEAIRTPALMRWSIEQCFNECKDYLGMDHYEVRTWQGWRRHILLTLIAHLFVIKLRQRFAIMPDDIPRNPRPPAPVVDKPVDTQDYTEAVIRLQNNQEINHTRIHAFPTRPQQVLTIGLILDLVNAFMAKVGHILLTIDHKMQSSAASYNFCAQSKVTDLVNNLTSP
jgi:SRSO17 transposase